MSTLVSKNVQIGADATATNNFTIYQPATPNGTLLIGNGNTGITSSLVALTSSGNLGLGVTPSAWTSYKAIQVGATGAASFASSNSSEATVFANAYLSGGTFKYVNSAAAGYYSQSAGGHAWAVAPSGTAGNAITFTQAMTLDAGGNLLVGTTTAGDGKVRISASANSFNLLKIDDTGSTAGNYVQFLNSAGAQAGTINHSGATSVSYNSGSDYRLKTITGPVTNSTDFINALKPKVGTWKEDGSKFVGFLAHEFAEVCPQAVQGEKDAVDIDGNPLYQSMEASSPEVIANIVSLLQEQQALILTLQEDVAALKAAA